MNSISLSLLMIFALTKNALVSCVDYYASRFDRVSATEDSLGSNERKVEIAGDYEVTYGDYFKIVRTKCAFEYALKNPQNCERQTYVLRKRAMQKPTVDPVTLEPIEGNNGTTVKHFEIPAKNISVGGTYVMAYLEVLGVSMDVLKLMDSGYMHSPCMQKAKNDGLFTGDVSVYDSTAWSEKCDELNVDLAFTDEFLYGSCENRKNVNLVFHGNSDDTALLRAEWIKFMSLFFDKEQFANEYYALEAEAYKAVKSFVNTTVVNTAANASKKLKCVWVQRFCSGTCRYEIMFDTYRSTLCSDAGMIPFVSTDSSAGEKKSFTADEIEAFHSAIRDYDVVIDESYYSDVSSFAVTDYEENLGFNELSGTTVKAKSGNGGKLLRVDASMGLSNTTDLKESGEVRPSLLLNNLVSTVHGTFKAHEDCPVYFRLATEKEIYVTHEDCANLTLADIEKKCVTALRDQAILLTTSGASYSLSTSSIYIVVAIVLTTTYLLLF